MKLKKIASLMLAGVMAVSMLAGCSGKSTDDNNNGQENNGTQTTGVSAAFASNLSDKDTVKFDDNVTYQAVLAKAAKMVDDSTIKAVTTIQDCYNLDDIYNDITGMMVVGSKGISSLSKSDIQSVTKKTTYVCIYRAPGDVDKNVVLAKMAAVVDDNLSSETLPKNSLKGTETAGAKYYTYDYTGSVSMEKAETKIGNDAAWYVLVTLTVNPTAAEMPKS